MESKFERWQCIPARPTGRPGGKDGYLRGHAHDHVYGRSFRTGSAASLPPCCDVDFVPRDGKRTYTPVSSVSARMGVLSIDAHRDLRGLCIGPTCRPTHLWVRSE